MVRQAPARSERYELTEVSGLALRVSLDGSKRWGWRYRAPNGKQKRLTIGTYPKLSLSDARVELERAKRKLAEGRDPADDRPVRETVADLVETYLERHGRKLRSAAEEERRLRADILPEIGSRKVAEITRRELADLLHRKLDAVLAGKGTTGASVNRLHANLQRLFGKAVTWGWIENSPADRLEKPAEEKSRSTAITDEQLPRVWNAVATLEDPRMALALRLQLVTATRLGEVVGAKLAELDLAAGFWVVPAERSKNSRPHEVPLSPMAIWLFRQALSLAELRRNARIERHGEQAEIVHVFPGWRTKGKVPHLRRDSTDRAFRQLVEKIGLSGLVPHDLRRTAATGMAALAVEPHVVEAVLGHVSGFRAGVSGIYNRHSYEREKRAALERWATHLGQLCDVVVPADETVTPLRRNRSA
jgi:integrase